MSKLRAVRERAIGYMMQHGLVDWTFRFSNAKRQAGYCIYPHAGRPGVIGLSRYFAVMNSDDEIKDIILHEIAHALAGHSHGHDSYWKAICRRIGAKPVRCYSRDNVAMPKGKYVGTCSACGFELERHRLPRRPVFHRTCGRGSEMRWIRR